MLVCGAAGTPVLCTQREYAPVDFRFFYSRGAAGKAKSRDKRRAHDWCEGGLPRLLPLAGGDRPFGKANSEGTGMAGVTISTAAIGLLPSFLPPLLLIPLWYSEECAMAACMVHGDAIAQKKSKATA